MISWREEKDKLVIDGLNAKEVHYVFKKLSEQGIELELVDEEGPDEKDIWNNR